MGFSRQEYWSGLPFPSPGDLPDPGIKPGSPTLQADTLPSEPPGKPIKYMNLVENIRDVPVRRLCCCAVLLLSCVLCFAIPQTVAFQAPLSMGFSRQNTGVDCHFLLQVIFPTQGSNLGLPHWRQILYCLSCKGSPDSAKPPLKSLSQSSRLFRNSYVRGYCFS